MKLSSWSVLLLVPAVVGLLLAGGHVSAEDPGAEATFPESHKGFLGASSHRALFGWNTNSVTITASSDTGVARPPRVGTNIRMNDPQKPIPDGLLGRSETTIAATSNGKYLVAGWNDADGFNGPPFGAPFPPPPVPGLSGFAYSSDGGKTWTDGGAPFNSGSPAVMTRGDPSLDTAGEGSGTFYFANLAVFSAGPPVVGVGMIVHRGSFTGNKFAWTHATVIPKPAPGDFLDKELLAADKRKGSQNVYVTVTNFKEVGGIPQFGFGQIEMYRSTDGAATFSRSIIQPDETISVPANTGVVNQGSAPAVGPDGTVYVTWLRGFFGLLTGGGVQPQIVVSTSTDNGATWGARVNVADISAGTLFKPAGYNRGSTNDFPRIAVAQSGKQRGRVYVAYQDSRIANGGTQLAVGNTGNGDTDVYVGYSDDKGATWTTALVAGGGDGKIQFWPTVSVQPGDNIDVTYYESVETDVGNGPTSLVDLFWAQSLDGGATWQTPVRVTNVTTDWGATATNIFPNFGDYNTAVSAGDRLFCTWADGRNGVPDAFFAKILTIGKAPR